MKRRSWIVSLVPWLLVLVLGAVPALGWTPVPVKQDPLVRMPGTQPVPENTANIEAPGRCTNCHGGFDQAVEPAFNWQGSMMAQAARDFLFYACLTTATQDSIWAVGTPNAGDICERCHFPQGWLEGRSDPPNASLMTASDYDGVHCDFCHSLYDPFFETTANGSREGSDWRFYWDETNASATPSSAAALATYTDDARLARTIRLFNGGFFFSANLPPANYVENTSGQFFISDNRNKRASFADASARHAMFYSRYHKSKYLCATCHDVSNPVLANLGANPAQPLPTELNPAASYFHVERTFSEFMLSAYGQQGGAAGIGPFAPGLFKTSRPGDAIATCQDCHMRDGVGKACSQNDGVIRPTNSIEHPQSGQPIHDLTGGNAWVSTVLASSVVGSPNYDAINAGLLRQGPAVLTLDLTQGLGLNAPALLAGADRAMQQLRLAASIQDLAYDAASGSLSFKVQNQTGHKLISGFPEGRRMWLNIKAYQAGQLVAEINPFDAAAATLKGLQGYLYEGQGALPDPAPLAPGERHEDALVYEMKPTSALTGEAKTFHFALATGRYKDNRIPPKGFRIDEAATRISVPVAAGVEAPGLYSAQEYLGGYDQVTLSLPPGADYIEVGLYYQTTSREYIEFLRDEIDGYRNSAKPPTLSSPGAGGDPAYLIQTDPFFARLRAWGTTIWQLWTRNRNVTTAAPFLMASATVGMPSAPSCDLPAEPLNLTATALKGKKIRVDWSAGTPAPTGGFNLYYDQAGKRSLIATLPATTLTYTDAGLARGTTYCYLVTAWNDCNGDGLFTPGVDQESVASNMACATALN